jgi:hypothetical protein
MPRAPVVLYPQQEAKKTTDRPCLSAFAVFVAHCKQVERGRPQSVEYCVLGGDPMLDTRFANTPHAEGPPPQPADDALPAIVVKAQEDARCRLELARLGYSKVRSEYARHKREGMDTFAGLGHESLWPTIDFVRDWLREERSRIVAQARWPFLLTMLATIVAGLAFAAVAALLG